MTELTVLEKDTIAEVSNISLGASATALSTILNKMVDITTPRLEVMKASDVQQDHPVPCLAVEVEYIAGLEGSNLLLIKESDALAIAALMMGEAPDSIKGPLTEIEQSAVQEAMNQMMGSMATSMSELFMRPIDISPPTVERVDLTADRVTFKGLSDDDPVVRVEFSLYVEDIIDSIMIQVISLPFAKQMAAQLLSGISASVSEPEADLVTGVEVGAAMADESAKTLESTEQAVRSDSTLSALEKDTIAEVGNISLGASATALSNLLNKVVDITTPSLSILKVSEIQEKYPIPCLLVEVDYISGLEGSNMLLVKEHDALIIAALMMNEDHDQKAGPLSEIEMSAVQEAMNQMMGSMATSMSELFMRPIDISPPKMKLIDFGADETVLYDLDPEDEVVHVAFSIKVEDVIDSVMVQVVPLHFARKMAGYLLQDYAEAISAEIETSFPEAAADPVMSIIDSDHEEKKVHFSPVEEGAECVAPISAAGAERLSAVDLQKLEMVKDIPMDVVVVLGSARLPLGKLFSLGFGGIVDLDCNESDPVAILANDRLLAKGEVVMINDQLGVRITEIQLDEVLDDYGF